MGEEKTPKVIIVSDDAQGKSVAMALQGHMPPSPVEPVIILGNEANLKAFDDIMKEATRTMVIQAPPKLEAPLRAGQTGKEKRRERRAHERKMKKRGRK